MTKHTTEQLESAPREILMRTIVRLEAEAEKRAAVKPTWYELDFLEPVRDVLLVVGFASLIYGVGGITGPAGGMIVAGVGVMAAGWLLSKKPKQ